MKSVVVSLTTNELAAVLALCGYETMANQILNSMDLENSVEFDRFIENTEISLMVKGLKDDSRDTMVIAELEELVHALVQSRRKVRCIRKDKVLFIHLIEGGNRLLFQEINNNTHTFYIHYKGNELQSVLLKHFELNVKIDNQKVNTPTLQLTEKIYNQLHQIDLDFLDSMIQDNKIEKPLRQFLSDFRFNQQEFDNLSLIEMDYIKDHSEMKEVIFLLPSEDLVWHLDYDNIHQQEVYVVPFDSTTYGNNLSEKISIFFEMK